MVKPDTTIPQGSWVLVTGATGYVASHVVGHFLERGYKVRGTVRDLDQASWLVSKVYKDYADKGDFELFLLRDLAVENAFDEAVKGMSAIAHLATISSFDPDPNNVVPQTVAGATSVLEAAIKEPMVREVVYTGTFVAATNPFLGIKLHVKRDTWNDAAVKAAWSPPPYEPARAMATYSASKVAAEQAIWKFVEERKPSFTVNCVSPSAIIGEPLHKRHATQPAGWVDLLYNGDIEKIKTFPAAGYYVDVKDIAALHVAAVLDPEVRNARLQAWGHNLHWNDLLPVLRKLCPEHKFISDFPDYCHLTITTDEEEVLVILRKWGGGNGWKPVEQTIRENLNNLFFE